MMDHRNNSSCRQLDEDSALNVSDLTTRHRRLVTIFSFLMGLLLLTACSASKGPPRSAGHVRVVSVEPMLDTSTPPMTTVPQPNVAVGSNRAIASEALESVEPAVSTRDALAQAIDWATEAMTIYLGGNDLAAARDSLEAARIMLLEADLPEAMQEQGLSMLNCILPAALQGHDLEALFDELEGSTLDGEPDERAYIAREARRILARFGTGNPTDNELRVFVDEVARYVDYYQGKQRAFFERSYTRKHKYWPTIEAVFTPRRIPLELGYMALVESGFQPSARSHANARGLWQFIPGTGRRYGLNRTDDFYDVPRATEAAAEYILDLIGIFGPDSFLLATAAYNAGEGRIQGCLRKLDDPFGDRNFWAIRRCLARETREYVPRILAAAIIGSDPKRFGFDLPSEAEMRERFDIVTIAEPTSLARIAARAGTTVAELRTHNDDLATHARSTPTRNFPLYVPKGAGDRLANQAPTPTERREANPANPPRVEPGPARSPERSSVASTTEYVVQRGDTLSQIAERHGLRVADIEASNPFLQNRVLRAGDRLALHAATLPQQQYTVQSGDTLSQIAERFGIATRDLASRNGLRSPYRLKIGQSLMIDGIARQRTVTFTIQSGNTLQTIAQAFSVRYRDLMARNNLKTSRLRAGQRLTIHPPQPMQMERYTVRRGDTIGRIARRFGVRTSDLFTFNGLGPRSVIRPGQELTVYVTE